ncbi:MAG: hypothetical protein IH624_13820 [Phycisphaerae bacterium]|nr:hypothetical protein [Phycisphaerae bacterium]
MRRSSLLAIRYAILLSTAVSCAANYGGGSGTPEDPYQIWTAGQLNEIGLHEEDWDKTFVLRADVSMTEFPVAFNVIGYYVSTLDETRNLAFSGTFDGNSHVIQGLTVPGGSGTKGLFGYVGTGGVIKNLRVEDVQSLGVAGLAGVNKGHIENCHMTGSIESGDAAGGLVGTNYGTIVNCSSSCSVIVRSRNGAGGLVGRNHGSVVKSWSTGRVEAVLNPGNPSGLIDASYLGGLIGRNYGEEAGDCRVVDCFSAVTVVGGDESDYLGGLIGINGVEMGYETGGSIQSCFATGDVWGGANSDNVGGLAGYSRWGDITGSYASNSHISGAWNVGGFVGKALSCSITQSYANVDVQGTVNVGGFVGVNNAGIANCYSRGRVEGQTRVGGFVGYGSNVSYCYSTGEVQGAQDAGGFAGSGSASTVFQCYWDVETSGIGHSDGGEGRTTSEMQSSQLYQYWGHCNVLWKIGEGNDYPRLAWEETPGALLQYQGIRWSGAGTYEEPFLIGTAEELSLIGLFPCEWDKHFRMVADIDMAAIPPTQFQRIGTIKPFTGVFDGGGHVIFNFAYANSGADIGGVGLFSGTASPAIIRRVGLENINVVAAGASALGGLVGNSGGIICECYATGHVEGYDFVGGLVGQAMSVVSDCYANVEVLGHAAVGGLVGKALQAEVQRCYSVGHVAGSTSVEGLVGSASSSVVTACFQDYQTSGRPGMYAWTTEQMQDMATYVGWDFVDGGDDRSDIWAMPVETGYPILWWQLESWPALPQFSGGRGTPEDPYLISTKEDLNNIGENGRLMSAAFEVVNDIDMSGSVLKAIGGRARPFEGSFDGGNRSIGNYMLPAIVQKYGGTFPWIGEHGRVQNLTLHDVVSDCPDGQLTSILAGVNYGTVRCVHVTGTISGMDSVGILARENYGSIESSSAAGSVQAESWSGGLVGMNHEVITRCSADCQVEVTGMIAGGIAGVNYGAILESSSTSDVNCRDRAGCITGMNTGVISNCYTTGQADAEVKAGGIAGYNSGGMIERCISQSVVEAKHDYAGAITGHNAGEISQCAGWGNIRSGKQYAGGVTGHNEGVISNTYSSATVAGKERVGGISGFNMGELINCYSIAPVTGSSTTGGIVGEGNGTTTGCFWDKQMSGVSSSASGMGLNLADMLKLSTYVAVGWDFTETWSICNGRGHPYLLWEGRDCFASYGGGSGTANEPYELHTAEHFYQLTTSPGDWSKHFIMMEDIDFAGLTWEYSCIGVNAAVPFSGTFDGNGHYIRNFYYNAGGLGYAGLFGYLDYNAMIKHLGLSAVEVTGRADKAGILAGCNLGVIVNCCAVDGKIDGWQYVGGLIGINSGTIGDCYTSISVTGFQYLGGIAGQNKGRISNCYVTGHVDETRYVAGAIAGSSQGVIHGCVWDTDTTQCTKSAGGTGKKTEDMQLKSTFLVEGWDFVNEGNSSDIWEMPEGGGYPILWWQLNPWPDLPSFSGGSGTAAEPYLVSSAEDLNHIMHNPRLMARNFKLVSDIDLSGVDYSMIGTAEHPFEGIFDGNQHKVFNWECRPAGTGYVGFFSFLDGRAQVRYLRLGNINISAPDNDYVGGICGYSKGAIRDCFVNGTVTGRRYTGGICGYNSGVMTRIGAMATITGESRVGGIIGQVEDGVVRSCFADGQVTADSQAGGPARDGTWSLSPADDCDWRWAAERLWALRPYVMGSGITWRLCWKMTAHRM